MTDPTTALSYQCPRCGRDGREYVARLTYWRYVCPQGHTWKVYYQEKEPAQ